VQLKGLEEWSKRTPTGLGQGEWTVVSEEKLEARPRKEAGGPTRMVERESHRTIARHTQVFKYFQGMVEIEG